MMDNRSDPFANDIDWKVYKHQQTVPPSLKEEETYSDMPLGNRKELKIVDTFLGKMPENLPEFKSGTPEFNQKIKELIGSLAGGPSLNVISGFAKKGLAEAEPLVMKGIQYMQPHKEAERFRETLGQGTSAENIEELSKRAQFASKSAQEEALIPKRELLTQAGKERIYPPSELAMHELPEGNIQQFSEMIEPGTKFNQERINSLSKALKEFRKNKDLESFIDKSEEIFNIPELNAKDISKIEDVLSMKRGEGNYFKDSDVTNFYSKKGKLIRLHNKFKDNPIFSNFDSLRSELLKAMRKVKPRVKYDDLASQKYDQLETNLNNLDKDAEQFKLTLPQNLQNLYDKFRQGYREYASTYTKGEKETGASQILRRLAEGRSSQVKDTDIVKLFGHPTKADKKAILDMGEGAARNAIYAALQHVPHGNAEKMANTILDLKRTKGFDKIITPEMENWANNMLHQIQVGSYIKKGLGAAGGATIGGLVGGPIGATVGASVPWAKELAKLLYTKFKK